MPLKTLRKIIPVPSLRWLTRLSTSYSRRVQPTPDYETEEEYLDNLVELKKLRVDNFRDLGLPSWLCRSLEKENIVKPTAVQCLALPDTLSREHNCVIQSETGTGKTLTYLLPSLLDTRPGLTSLIITPTRELATQVYHWTRKLAGSRKDSRRAAVLFSGPGESELLPGDRAPHILIGTPKRLLELMQKNKKLFQSVRRVVLDEGDKILQPIGQKAPWRKRRARERHPRAGTTLVEEIVFRRGGSRTHLICTSATVGKALRSELFDIGWGDNAKYISTVDRPSLPEGIDHCYVDCRAGEEELSEEGVAEEMEDVVEEDDEELEDTTKVTALVNYFRNSKLKSALVFIRGTSPIDWFVKALVGKGLKAAPLYKAILPGSYEQTVAQFSSGEIEVLVGTEQSVRGLDFCFVDTMFLVGVPRNADEYIHLAGRVGRMGNHGRVVVMVTDDSPRELVRLQRIYNRLKVEGREEKTI